MCLNFLVYCKNRYNALVNACAKCCCYTYRPIYTCWDKCCHKCPCSCPKHYIKNNFFTDGYDDECTDGYDDGYTCDNINTGNGINPNNSLYGSTGCFKNYQLTDEDMMDIL